MELNAQSIAFLVFSALTIGGGLGAVMNRNLVHGAIYLIVSLFGPTPPLIAHFAWILAISFVATGSMLLEVASCARRESV